MNVLKKFFCVISIVVLHAFTLSTLYGFSGEVYEALQNDRVITGRVVSSIDGEALPGVSVVIPGTSQGTVTDIDGNFNLSVPANTRTLQFSFIGMKTQTVDISSGNTVQVRMEDDTIGLEEVIAIGYGVTRKSDLTGSVVSVDTDEINKFPATNVNEMLRGQAAGVQVTSSSGAPGSSSSVLIRGNRSLSSNQSPLYIVDGMVVPHIDDLNSSDIESIEILKDASSQAIYGARASNGVILVTTKRGKAGKVTVDLNSYMGFQQFQRNFEVYNPDEWLKLRYWAKYNEGTANVGTPDNINTEVVLDDQTLYDTYQNKHYLDWENLAFTNAPQYKHDLSLRGGTEKIKFSAGFGYLDQNGVIEKSGYQRGSFRLNTDMTITDWLDMGANFSYAKASRQEVNNNFNDIVTLTPFSQAYNEDGTLRRETTSSGDINPLWEIENYDEERQDEFLTTSVFTNLKLLKGLNYRFSANIRSNNRESGEYRNKLYPGSTGEGSLLHWKRFSWLIDNVINYQLPFNNEDHRMTVSLIQSAEEDLTKSTGMDFINSTTDMFKWDVIGDSEIEDVNRSIIRERTTSYAARLQYSLLDRYLFTGSVRRDGASVFGRENKWATFPSAAFAWRINEEPFMESTRDWMDMMKLRLSYGVVGNAAIPAYRTLGLSNSYEYLFDGNLSVGYLPSSQLQNLSLKWETTGSLNTGLDFIFLGGRISSTIEYFNTNTDNLLIQRTIPSLTGYDSMWDNLGKTKSWGWEFSLDTKIIDQKDFSLNVGANFSTQKNEIVEIDGRVDEEGKPVNDIGNNWFIGEPIHVDYQYVFGGIWQEDEIENLKNLPEEEQKKLYLEGDPMPKAGEIKIQDYNKDGKISSDDRKIFNLDPEWYASFNVDLFVKGFDLSADFYTVQGIQKNNPYLYLFGTGGGLNGNLNGMKVNYWTPTVDGIPGNRSNEAPKPQFTAAVPWFSILGMQDASYFRLRSLTVGYTLPASFTRNMGIERLRLYTTGTNLFTLTDFKSYSPESNADAYPEPQVFTFGLNLTF